MTPEADSENKIGVKNLLKQTNNILKNEQSAKQKIKELDQQLLFEQLKQQKFFKVAFELNKLKDQKPEFLRQFFEQTKKMDESLSETEINSKVEYELSRLDHKLQNMLEKDRKKKQMAQMNAK